MAKLALKTFSGLMPLKDPAMLELGQAAVATDTKLVGGDIEGFGALAPTVPATSLSTSSTIRTIYRFGQALSAENLFWFQSFNDADFVRGQIAQDVEERTYYTGESFPRKTRAGLGDTASPYPTASLRMGVPKPTTAPSVTLSGSATDPDSTATSVVYAVTYVTSWGEEGAPSPLTATVDRRGGQSVVLASIPTGASGAYSLAAKRIYRSASGSSATKLQFLAEIALGTTTYTDTFSQQLGDVIVTTGFDEPPDTMVGLTAMANGVMAGFTGNTVCFSEPYYPYAWPVRYRQPVDAPIVGLGAFGQSLLVGTTQGIHVFTGADSASMTSEKVASAQSCASGRSIVEVDGGVVFASHDGLFLVTASGVKNLTRGLMTRKEWEAYAPSSMHGYEIDGGLIMFFDTGSRQGGMVFTFDPEPSFVETSVYATAGYRDRKTKELYLVVGNVLRKWDSGSPMTWTWRSGTIRVDSYMSFAAARVDASSYPVTFRWYAGDTLVHTQTVESPMPFRLPAVKSWRFALEISGASRVYYVAAATSLSELGDG